MQFRIWLEADELNPLTKKHLEVQDQFTIKQEIQGWNVYFVDYIATKNLEANKQRGTMSNLYHNYVAPIYRNWAFRFKKAVQSDIPYVNEALSRIHDIGLIKSFNVPIVIYYKWREGKDSKLGNAQFGKYVGESNIPVSKPYSPPKQNWRMSNIQIWRREDENQEQMVTTIAHEIGHHIYAALNEEQQKYIAQLAQKTKAPSRYGDPRYGKDKENAINWESGNEWFAEMIAKIMLYDNPQQRNWMQKAFDFLRGKEHPYDKKVYGAVTGMVKSVQRPFAGTSRQVYEPLMRRKP